MLTNRSLALGMLWITCTLGLMRRESEQRRREAEEQTREHLSDLAHVGRLKTSGSTRRNTRARTQSTTSSNLFPSRDCRAAA